MSDTDLQWGPPDILESLADAWPACRDAVATFGSASQRVMMLEEAGELIAAISQESRGRKVDVAAEVADVLIMALQMAHLYGEAQVAQAVDAKIDRIRKRIAAHMARQ
jgi:NTP pyrophosphatase (non-canonical NTP hydrolase)